MLVTETGDQITGEILPKKGYGRASSQSCPKRGYVCLRDKITGMEYVVATNCRTWSCLGCRDRNLAAVRARIRYGCWMAKRSSFITVTYRYAGPSTVRTRTAVGKDLARLLYKLKKRSEWSGMKWFAVPELTKKGQVHVHLIVSDHERAQEACTPRAAYDLAWAKVCRVRGGICAEHEWASYWSEITGDSFVVDARAAYGDPGRYLGKYMSKSLAQRQGLVGLGFVRRWSCSRNWPRGEMRMQGSIDDRWQATAFVWPHFGSRERYEKLAERDRDRGPVRRVGSVEATRFDIREKNKRELRKLRKGLRI